MLAVLGGERVVFVGSSWGEFFELEIIQNLRRTNAIMCQGRSQLCATTLLWKSLLQPNQVQNVQPLSPQHCRPGRLSDVCGEAAASRQPWPSENVTLLWFATDHEFLSLCPQNASEQNLTPDERGFFGSYYANWLWINVFALGMSPLPPLLRTLLTLNSLMNMQTYCHLGRHLGFGVRRILWYACLCHSKIHMLKS